MRAKLSLSTSDSFLSNAVRDNSQRILPECPQESPLPALTFASLFTATASNEQYESAPILRRPVREIWNFSQERLCQPKKRLLSGLAGHAETFLNAKVTRLSGTILLGESKN